MGVIFILIIFTLLMRHLYFMVTMTYGLAMRKVLTGFIFKKVMKLS